MSSLPKKIKQKRQWRRYIADKKANKRWKMYHSDTIKLYPFVSCPVVGMYRKAKGCECRHCTAINKERKIERNKKERRVISVLEEYVF